MEQPLQHFVCYRRRVEFAADNAGKFKSCVFKNTRMSCDVINLSEKSTPVHINYVSMRQLMNNRTRDDVICFGNILIQYEIT